jgi:copper homeostasis protein
LADILLEVCVDDPTGLADAIAGGADRIELCSALGLGGLTPSYGLMQAAAGCGIPCMAMIRPRAGDFIFTAVGVAVMRADIRAARAAGLAGVVIGASRADGGLDADVLADLLAEAKGMDVTLHRAIDMCPDPVTAVGVAMNMGFRRILSSGGAATAPDGAATLAAMMARAGPDCIIMPGSGITVATLPRLAGLPLREIHASCATVVPSGGRAVAMGFQTPGARRTARAQVAALKAALAD